MKTVIATLCLVALAQPCLAQTVTDTDFVIKVPDGKGGMIVESGTVVPLSASACYEWRVRLNKTKGDVTATEIFRFPKAPLDWGTVEEMTFSEDERVGTSQLRLSPVDNWISNERCVLDGDPAGSHSFEVRAFGKLLHRFLFEVQDF
jgi:hypothetical protein